MNRLRIRIRRRFTLVELILAITLLALIMAMLFRFFISTKNSSRLSRVSAQMHSNAQTVFELIKRDLQFSLTSSVPGNKIGFYIGDPDTSDKDDCLAMTCVSTSDTPSNAESRMCEISYKFHTDNDDLSNMYYITRQVVGDNDTNWDFYGTPANWETNTTATNDFERVIGGVSGFGINFYDRYGAQIPGDTDTTVIPHKIVINITLFDEQLKFANDEARYKTQRSFTQVLYLYQSRKK